MALRPHAARAGSDVLSPTRDRLLRAAAALTLALAAAAGAAGAAMGPEPVGVVAGPFPPPLATFTRPSPALLEVLSDMGHPVRFEPPRGRPAAPWVPANVDGAALRRIIPQGTVAFAIYGDDFSSERYVAGLDLRRQVVRYVLDLEALTRTQAATAADAGFVYAGVGWAREADGVLYVSNAHSTYASSSRGRNAAITAIDLRTRRALWRSPSLVANAGSFVLAPGGRLVAGYGFTAEPDFVYVLDRTTGRVLDRLPVRDGPESITRRGNEIHVETYTRSLVLRLRT